MVAAAITCRKKNSAPISGLEVKGLENAYMKPRLRKHCLGSRMLKEKEVSLRDQLHGPVGEEIQGTRKHGTTPKTDGSREQLCYSTLVHLYLSPSI